MANFSGGDLLTEITNMWPKLGILLRKHETAINTTAQNAAVSPTAELQAPSAPGQVNVKVAGEIAHITVDSPQQAQRGVNTFVELSTNPKFSQPHVEDLGASRGKFINLPTKDDSGATLTWHARAYHQLPGSQPGAFTYFGGVSPSSFTMGGTTQLTPLPSQGSGTASNDGQQGGRGLGKVLIRPAVTPKRVVNAP